MRIVQPDLNIDKGWFAGPWDSDLDISIGYANTAVNEPHYHRTMTEIYFFARGQVSMVVDGQEICFTEKSGVIIEPGEVHTFLSCSDDHYHFVIQTPGLQGEEARADKIAAS
ncbi:MAG: cupin domain-containing protein [Gemmatimonadetes bacterium]|jgi:mannose-6-phosphate isomerase-like protein (cupin superfamily)|nr:cupin domain-containing protein [Gemmatimonadota bacterium]